MKHKAVIGSAKWIILESVYGKVPYKIFDSIWQVDNVESVNDLQSVLSKDDFESVLKHVKMYFFRQAVDYYLKYLDVVGDNFDMLSDGLVIEG